MLSATFLTASFFASFFALLASLSGLVLVVQFLGALHALSLIASFSITLFLCASLILHSFMCEDLPSVSWFEQPTEGHDSRDRSLWPFAAHVSSTMAYLITAPLTVQSYLSARLRCAAHFSRGSARWMYS